MFFSTANASFFEAYAVRPREEGVRPEDAYLYDTPLSIGLGTADTHYKAGVKVGPAVAEFNPNLNTVAMVSSSHAEASFLGFGVSVGSRTHVATPFGKIGFKF